MNAFKQQCIELRRKDYTLSEIVAETGRSKTSVYFHIKDIPLSDEKQRQISEQTRTRALRNAEQRKGVSTRAFKAFANYTPDHTKLLAHLMFDGELLKGRCRYHNRSDALVHRVERLMQKVYTYPPRKQIDSVSGVISLGYYNVALSAYLFARAKNLLTEISLMPREHQRSFLQAFFDDEGCMDFRTNGNRRRVRGYQKDRSVLVLIQSLLKNFNIESMLRMPNEVVVTGRDNLIAFQKEINFSRGVRINPKRTNSIWKKNLEKRVLLDMAIKSFKM